MLLCSFGRNDGSPLDNARPNRNTNLVPFYDCRIRSESETVVSWVRERQRFVFWWESLSCSCPCRLGRDGLIDSCGSNNYQLYRVTPIMRPRSSWTRSLSPLLLCKWTKWLVNHVISVIGILNKLSTRITIVIAWLFPGLWLRAVCFQFLQAHQNNNWTHADHKVKPICVTFENLRDNFVNFSEKGWTVHCRGLSSACQNVLLVDTFIN